MSKKPNSTGAMFAALAAGTATTKQESEHGATEAPAGAGAPPSNLGLFTGRESAIRAAASGKRLTRITRKVPPERCRIWALHNRRYDMLSPENCADLIEGFRTKGGQEFPAIVRMVRENDQYDYEVICGARRHWTATHLKMDLLIEERELTDEEAFVLSDKENRDRKDISDYERALDYLHALDLYYGGVQSRMAQIIGMDPSVLSRYLDVARLDQSIVAAVADVREISRNQVRELKVVMEPGAKLTKPQADQNRDAILERARELAAEEVKRPALDVFRALMAAASSDKTKRGRPSMMLGEVLARSSGKTAVLARSKGRRGLILELYGESGAPGEEVMEAIKELVGAHYRPV
jgi:ParB family transcriptional regulator, chromosome partitioning protein